MTSKAGGPPPALAAEEQLCSPCSKLTLRRYLAPMALRLLWDLPMHVKFDHGLEVSPTANCASCRILAKSLGLTSQTSSVLIPGVQFKELGNTQTFSGTSTSSFCMQADWPGATSRLAPFGIDAFRLGSCRSSYGRFVQPECADRQLVQSWLESCEKKHDECSIDVSNALFARTVAEYVIDVEEMTLKRVGGEQIRYLALSYVWGKIPSLQLRKHNLSMLTNANALRESYGELSNVVKDAMTFTRELWERYLWVDSLCICQDDSTMKEAQIASMNTV